MLQLFSQIQAGDKRMSYFSDINYIISYVDISNRFDNILNDVLYLKEAMLHETI